MQTDRDPDPRQGALRGQAIAYLAQDRHLSVSPVDPRLTGLGQGEV
jgi:hypothetical protein